MRNEASWFGQLTMDDNFLWTAGSTNPKLSSKHIFFDLKNPMYISRHHVDNSLIISSGGNRRIFKIFPQEENVITFIDAEKYGLKDIGNCVVDKQGNIWINEITGYQLWQFDSNGNKLQVLGNGKPGFQKEPASFDSVQFNWIYDIRMGFDNNLYVLDSGNFALRKVDIENCTVNLIAGTGKPGYSGDGGFATEATFGSDVKQQFDGPWALSVDDEGNIFIGDTQNHVVRMINKNGIISTILGSPNYIPSKRNLINETNPYRINLPKICSMDYYNNELFIPEWDGDLIILEKIKS